MTPPRSTRPFFTAVARGCEDIAQASGYTLVIANTDGSATREAAALYNLAAERVAGVIVSSSGQASDELKHVLRAGIPIVALDRRVEGLALDCVTTDGETAAYIAIQHLLQLGHKRIAVIGGPEEASTLRERLRGARRALREAGAPADLVRIGDMRERGGHAAAHELLSLPNPPTVLFTDNDLTTVGALRALRERCVRVPRDLSIIGFGDLPMADLLDPRLTVVAQPTYQLGARAADLLLRRIGSSTAPLCEIVLMPTLVVRGSTAGPPRRRRQARAARTV